MIRLKKWLMHVSISLIAVIVFSPLYAKTTDIKDRDITLFLDIQLKHDDAVDAHMIDVTTTDGIVTLSGTVDNLLAKDQAVRIAESIKGVRGIVDNISVFPVRRTDQDIKKDVMQTLASDPATAPYKIDVTVKNGVVTLSGKVKFWNGRQLVAQLAKGVRGVKEMNNKIGYNHQESDRPDKEIKAAIKHRLRLDPYVYDGLIDVYVEDGKVTLAGTVGSMAEKTRAYNDAWVAGVKSVNINVLDVKWWLRNEMIKKDKFSIKSDEEIKKAVKDAFLYDSRVFSCNPQVEVKNGIVILSGVVDNLKAKRAAEEDALNTIGVSRVRNYLKVRPEKPPGDDEIAQSVKESLARDPVLEQDKITVRIRNKKVYLHGMVDNYYEKQRAEDVASRAYGVVDIKNNLKVEYITSPKSDWEIKQDIESELFWSYFVDSDDISVRVENGVATLKGTVDSWQELHAAIENAFEGGARHVQSQLQVKGDSTTDASGYYSSPYKYMQPPSPSHFPVPMFPHM